MLYKIRCNLMLYGAQLMPFVPILVTRCAFHGGTSVHLYECLLTSMAAVQAEDVRASFLFVGDLNGHHQEWLGSTTTNSHGVAAFDSATVSGCDQLVVGRPMHVVEYLTS